MKIEELEAMCETKNGMALDQICLVISRKTPPKHSYITVKGMGKGYVCNCKETEKGFDVIAYFKVSSVRRYIALVKASMIHDSPSL